MRTAMIQASLHIRAVSSEPVLFDHLSSSPRESFSQRTRQVAEYMHWKIHHEIAYIVLTTLNPTYIQYNWGLQGYTLFFLFLLKNIDCGYSLEPPRQGGSNEYQQSLFWAEIIKLP